MAGGFGEAVSLPENGSVLDSIELVRLDLSNLADSAMICAGATRTLDSGRSVFASLFSLDSALSYLRKLG